MFRKTRTFTHEEFIEYRNKERLKRNLTVFTLATAMYLNPVVAYAEADLTKIDGLGNRFLNTIRVGGYWIILIVAVADIIRIAIKGSKNEIGNAIIKYLLIYSSMYILPLLFDMIREVFA